MMYLAKMRRAAMLLLLCALVVGMCNGEEASAEAAATETQDLKEKEEAEEQARLYEATRTMDWGSYYDPKGEFCGSYDCYKILGIDYYETMENGAMPSRSEITKRYRKLSRAWHPDKNRMAGAKARFVKINKAYSVLTDDEKRKEYDYLRDHHDEYLKKYGSSVLWSYAPKSDANFVIFLLFAVGTAFTWFVQGHKWQTVADRLVKAAVEDWSVREGGSSESMEIRAKALEILAEQQTNEASLNQTDGGKAAEKKKRKVSAKERKLQEQEDLRPIVTEMVAEINDFGAGFHKPTWRDLLVVKMAKLPFAICLSLAWNTKYAMRRLRKQELNEEERQVLTTRAVGTIAWEAAADEDRQEMLTRDLWVSANLEDWRSYQEAKQAGSAEFKKYLKMRKKQGSVKSD
mmetsp:Transcript_11411/g.20837  ORF Transcript_11411/g.20837 Transcript_11411/m.20837 type:complete len:403 (-) Transcript_11411:981-2189(-)|eukprot:CAMPEP_0198283232 /NCGR_PEP_ID=MMETSP1449-20131203/2891_1 /TAXON_ID=420275 /ORGANISM="Attheya septentrionalis, Strain CCMP2084" /LENGTH=402 /DNA_ID=CAMNT_0043979795 /DNA_START=86 /DNA_END=1294 /DNA_ORIENTATION=+